MALTEGISNKRMRELALAGARARARACRMDRAVAAGARSIGRRGARRWPKSIPTPPQASARKRLAYDEIFANQLALLLLRQVARRKRGVPLQGDGRLTGKLQLPYRLTGAQQRVIERNPRRHGAGPADAAPAPGRCRLGQDAGRAAGDARGGRGGRAGGDARPDRNPRPPASSRRCSASARRSASASRSSPGARRAGRAKSVLMGLADGIDRHPRRHPRHLPAAGRLPEARA